MYSKLGVVAHSVISASQEVSLAYELEKLPEQWKEFFCLNIKPNEAVENMKQEGEMQIGLDPEKHRIACFVSISLKMHYVFLH